MRAVDTIGFGSVATVTSAAARSLVPNAIRPWGIRPWGVRPLVTPKKQRQCIPAVPSMAVRATSGVFNPQVLFGNPSAALGALTVDGPKARQLPAFCPSARTLLGELEWLLSKAIASTAAVAKAQTVYNDINGNVLYVGLFGNQCQRDTEALKSVIVNLRAELTSQGVSAPSVTEKSQTEAPEGSPWLKVAVIGGLGVAGLVAIGYAVRSFR